MGDCMSYTSPCCVYRETDVAAIFDGTQTLIDNSAYRVLALNNLSAAAWWGRGTRWCTCEPVWFEGYRRDGELFYIEHRPSARRWQLHVESGQLRNWRNRRANVHNFARRHPVVVQGIVALSSSPKRTALFFAMTTKQTSELLTQDPQPDLIARNTEPRLPYCGGVRGVGDRTANHR